MSEPTIYPPVVLDPTALPQGKWEQERQAFRRMLPELLKSHPGQYVAVHEGRVVDSGGDKVTVAWRAYEKYGYVPIYVGLVSDRPPPPVRMPSFRVIER
jgi:hypothetical protein